MTAMAMTILNNTASMMTLGELNKNISKVGKDLKKLSTGERLPDFASGASDVAISEKMRELVRSLGQNEKNVQTGASLMKTAEGGVKEQLELLKTVKQKVIDAANDSNTDADRAIIQKEIDQCFKEMEDIAEKTNYNGKRLLTGDPTDYHRELVPTIVYHPVLYHDQPVWVKLDEAKLIEESQIGWTPDATEDEIGIIPNNYNKLDGIEGPFDIFRQTTPGVTPFATTSTGLAASYTANAFTGGEDGDPKILNLDITASYTIPAELDGKGFSLGSSSQKYVFSYDASKVYDPSYKVVDISGCSNMSEVASALASAVSSNNLYYSATSVGGTVKFATKNNAALAEEINNTAGANGFSAAEQTTTRTKPGTGTYTTYKTSNASKILLNAAIPDLPAYLNGGKDGIPPVYAKKFEQLDQDSRPMEVTDYKTILQEGVPGVKASVTKDLSAATAGTAIKLSGLSTAYVIFTEGNAAPTFTTGANGKYTNPPFCTVGINYRGDISVLGNLCGIEMDMSSGLSSVKFTAAIDGTKPNNAWSVDNISASGVAGSTSTVSYTTYEVDKPAVPKEEEPITYSSVEPMELSSITTTPSEKDAIYATYNMNLTGMSNVENIIKELHGTSVNFGNMPNPETSFYGYFLYDSAVLSDYPGSLTDSGVNIDLNEFRTLANSSGNTLGALQSFFESKFRYNQTTATSNGIEIKASVIGQAGNSERIFAEKAGSLRHYDIDFGSMSGLPNSLIGRGFRVYCATDDHEWWNFQFTDEQDPEFEAERGESGSSTEHINSIRIDISKCTTGGDVAAAFYEQTHEFLTSTFDHFLRVEGNSKTGIVRFYDRRPYELTSANYDTLMGKGGGLDENYGYWKIADGVYDNIYQTTGDKWIDTPFLEEIPMQVPVKDFAIQDNPRANRTLWLKLPQTTLDKVLGFDKKTQSAEDFNVMTKEMRDKLLGERLNEQGEDGEVTGILDKGIVYLTDANTLIGSQIQRLNLSEANIVTKAENAKAAESVIRDADMAKEMVSFTKNNILMQASQAMMSQANQNASGILGLLQ
ncbi:MAG: hypothetical protein J6M62_05315 [Selenomonadaceae bacterium]|nr:hypothetical protein [Selenomonadaceae bacterium]